MKRQDASHAPPGGLPLSRLFAVDELKARGDRPIEIEADETERVALARAADAPQIADFRARFRITAEGRRVRARGEVRARLTRICVVSLDPFESEAVEPIDVVFEEPRAPLRPGRGGAGKRQAARAEVEEIVDLESEPPEPIVDGKIDLGAVAAEFFLLGLDPWPRKPGVAFEPETQPESPDEAPPSPFAALAGLQGPAPAAKGQNGDELRAPARKAAKRSKSGPDSSS